MPTRTVTMTTAAPESRSRSLASQEESVASPPARAGLEVRAPPEPTALGRFVVLRKIGAGGMGVVYAAYDEELDRKVAVKLVRTANSGARARERTVAEAKAMARLSHPNVVQVYEVGEYAEQLFVVMEFVRGVTLRAWLGEQPRSWRDIVSLFTQCGRGLLAAHRAGLVHCDFKPDNVLVDQDQRARVLDFGIARALRPADGDARRDGTRRGAVRGTPGYMSPEQLRGAPADARSDQFSFCVALWEALHGARPAVAVEASDSSSSRPSPQRAAHARAPAWLRVVISRGLEREPGARWPDMDALLHALQRDPWRVWRRALLVTGAIGAVAAGSALVAWRWAMPDSACADGPARLEGVWDPERAAWTRDAMIRVELAYARDSWRGARQLLDAYAASWVDQYVDACQAHRRGEQSGELLDLRMGCLERRRQELGTFVELLGRADADVVEKAVMGASSLVPVARCANRDALMSVVPLPGDPESVREIEAIRASLSRAAADQGTGRFITGRELAKAAASEARARDFGPLEAEALLRLGYLLEQAGDFTGAEDALTRAYWRADATRHDLVRAESSGLLISVVGVRLGRPEEGRRWAEHAGAVVRRLQDEGVAHATMLNNLGSLAAYQGDGARAMGHYQRASEIYASALGPAHPWVASTLNNLGSVYATQGRNADARAQLERSLEIFESALGPRHPTVAGVMTNLGSVLFNEGELDRAVAYHERALELYEETQGDDHPNIAVALSNLGNALCELEDYEDARAQFERAIAIREVKLGTEHPYIAVLLNNVGTIDLRLGRLEEAFDKFVLARTLLSASQGERHPLLYFPLSGLGQVALARDQVAGAIPLLERAIELGADKLGATDLAAGRFALARALVLHGGDRARARSLARSARAAYDDTGRKELRLEVDTWLERLE